MISSYTIGIYPRSEELIEATRKKTSDLSSLLQKETEDYISAQKNAELGFVSDPLLNWDDIFRPFSNLDSVTPEALNRIYEMNTFYRVLSFADNALEKTDEKIIESNLALPLLPENRTAAVVEPYTFANLHTAPTKMNSETEFPIELARLLRKEIDHLVNSGFKFIPLYKI